MTGWRKSRRHPWVYTLVTGVLLAGEVHLFAAEIFHHHTEVEQACQAAHAGGPYWHVAAPRTLLCPICQVLSNTSVRPAVQWQMRNPDQESHFRPRSRDLLYASRVAPSLLARAPPLC